jgi:ADP-ribosylglycohydrolase
MDVQTADKIKGIIFGQAIGDALGLGTEFLTKEQIKRYYPNGLTNYAQIRQDNHRQRWKVGDWTDDTDQMLCILDSILINNKIEITDIAKRIYDWSMKGGMGIGQTVKAVITSPQFLTFPHLTAGQVWLSTGKQNASNGAIMRTSILGVWKCQEPETVRKNAEDVCKITHFDPRCVASCICITSIICNILLGETNSSALFKQSRKLCLTYDIRTADYFERAEQSNINLLQLDENGKIGYTLKAMGAGLWCLLHSTNFSEGILSVIHEGGDADSNAAVAGSILGAKFGFSAIPVEWIDGLIYKKELEERVEKLLSII